MKKRSILSVIILITLTFHPAFIYSQDSIRQSIPIKQIQLKGESGEREVTLPLRDSLSYINFEIKAYINTGELTIELLDPFGEKYGNFSIAGLPVPEGKQETEMVRGKVYTYNASGTLVRYVKLPVRGMWRAKIITKDAFGLIDFNLTRGVTAFSIR